MIVGILLKFNIGMCFSQWSKYMLTSTCLITGEKKLEKHTPYTITDREILKKHLQEVRKAGYARSDQEVDIGARAISAPIFDRRKKLAGGLCIAGPVHRLSDERIKTLKKKVIDCAKAISAELK